VFEKLMSFRTKKVCSHDAMIFFLCRCYASIYLTPRSRNSHLNKWNV